MIDALDLLTRITRLVPVRARLPESAGRHSLTLADDGRLSLTVMTETKDDGGRWYQYFLDPDDTPESAEIYIRKHLTSLGVVLHEEVP